jgi:hypothetical protein
MIIQNTANGTGLTYSQFSAGVTFDGCEHSEVRNLSTLNIYQKTGNGSDGGSTNGIYYVNFTTTASIHGITCTWAEECIQLSHNGTPTSILVYNNSVDYNAHGLDLGPNTTSESASGLQIYGNSIGPHFDAFLDTAQTMHGDGIIVGWGVNAGSGRLSNSYIYNNYIHGDMSSNNALNSTGYIFLSGQYTNLYIFNNVIGQDVCVSGAPEGAIRINPTGGSGAGTDVNIQIINNTFYGGAGAGNCMPAVKTDQASSANGFITWENNIVYDLYSGINDDTGGTWLEFGTVDHNDYYGVNFLGQASAYVTPSQFASVWQATYSFDLHGSVGNPNINGSAPPWYITTGSAASGLGANLTSLSITALDSDAPYTFGPGYACGSGCTARPSSGAWPAGAYQVGNSLAAPTITPGTSTQTGSVSVMISGSAGATLCYTTNGSTPTTNGSGTCTGGTLTYSGAFSSGAPPVTINAVASESGFSDSSVATAQYSLPLAVAPCPQCFAGPLPPANLKATVVAN